MTTSGRAHVDQYSPGLHSQYPCPHSEPQLTPTTPGDPPVPTGKSSPGFCGVTALCWVPVHVVSVCIHKSGICFLQSCEALLSFKTKCSGGSSSRSQTLRLGSLMWRLELSLLWVILCNTVFFSFFFLVCGSPSWPVWDFFFLVVSCSLWDLSSLTRD